MARILFFPVFIIILALISVLFLRVKSMFSLSKGSDITLNRSTPFEGGPHELAERMLEALKAFSTVDYQSDILVDFRKITSHSKTQPTAGHNKIALKSKSVEIARENGHLSIKSGKSHFELNPAENPWIYYWCGVCTLEETLRLFYESEMKVQAGDTGFYSERKYTELIVLSHALSRQANLAFADCFSHMSAAFGKDLSQPDTRIRNLMVRILINNLTSMPDYIETKFQVFSGEDRFVCDYTQNSRLLY